MTASLNITTGASGSSFGPLPCAGKCFASSPRHRLDALDRAAPKSPALKSSSISAADLLPAGRADFGVDAAVGDDLDVAVGQQQIDQHAVVVRGVPDPQLRENIQRALPRRLIAKQRRAVERAFDHETHLAGMRGLARLDRLLDRASTAAENRAATRQWCSSRCLPMRPMPMLYQLPDAPPPPKLPPPPLNPPLSLL